MKELAEFFLTLANKPTDSFTRQSGCFVQHEALEGRNGLSAPPLSQLNKRLSDAAENVIQVSRIRNFEFLRKATVGRRLSRVRISDQFGERTFSVFLVVFVAADWFGNNGGVFARVHGCGAKGCISPLVTLA